ncbi:hypothetical protein GZ693_002178 [Campylobacter coli]|uniref:hypothetical protein n=2 Tax=Campylobacterales TaxID=213849 RepID=UPI00071731BA|nr:hypothetical protein [Campylobacter coli]EAI0449370.1 hypothetical protein [Campylobacter coli]EAI4223319.1 hypothetical protein [Campylobacter coli]EAI7500540.1 hypothetical protein [Campylobacter coli]EAI7846227.1 hypothetical protein [Campylobacter coli]EAJ8978010.1 hypothetical protein [Campylobacter coli]
MKYFILILISLITLIIFASYGLIQTSSADKETVRIAEEYGGIYVFDKEIRDEIIQKEKEREEARQKVTLGDTFWEQRESIDKNLPQILSNGCKYYIKGPSKQELKENDWSLYYQKIKEYMGEEIFEKLKKGLAITSYYVDKNGKVIPITMFTYISTTITTYGLYGDEGSGFRLTNSYSYGITGDNIFYLENGKFIKSDEKDKGGTH